MNYLWEHRQFLLSVSGWAYALYARWELFEYKIAAPMYIREAIRIALIERKQKENQNESIESR